MESIVVVVSFSLSDNSAIQLTPSGKDHMVERGTQLRALLLRYHRKRDLAILFSSPSFLFGQRKMY